MGAGRPMLHFTLNRTPSDSAVERRRPAIKMPQQTSGFGQGAHGATIGDAFKGGKIRPVASAPTPWQRPKVSAKKWPRRH